METRATASRGWRTARLAGIAAALISSAFVAAGATAAPGGEKGKPEKDSTSPTTTTTAPQEPQGNGNAYGQNNSSRPQSDPTTTPAPEPQSAPKETGPKPKPAKPAEPRPQASAPAKTHGSPHGPAAPAKTTPAGPKKSQNAGTGTNPQGRGPAGRTSYCHSTRSGSNPYVLITTNDNGLWAHGRHHDGDDIIPATGGDCPGGGSKAAPGGGHAGSGAPQGPPGKVTFCHSTRSATNPFVSITTAIAAIAAHAAHHGGDDVIPASGDCPGGKTKDVGPATPKGPDSGGEKVTICHSTSSEKNPFVSITIGASALAAHASHHAGVDVIPASGDCPAPVTQQVSERTVDTGGPGPDQGGSSPVGSDERPAEDNGNAPVAGDDRPGGPDNDVLADRGPGEGGNAPAAADEPGQGGTLDARATNPASGPGAAAAPLAEESASDDGDGGSLPFTGLGLVAVLAAALLALAAGIAVRRAANRPGA